jgi:septal ring factor EnvC (AmiA/AmiB activator)
MCCAVVQNSEISRLQSQLRSAGGQRQQLEQQMASLTQQMASAMASLGQFMPQQVR